MTVAVSSPASHLQLVVEGTQHGYTTFDPVLLGQASWHLHSEDEVRGVARGRQGTLRANKL